MSFSGVYLPMHMCTPCTHTAHESVTWCVLLKKMFIVHNLDKSIYYQNGKNKNCIKTEISPISVCLWKSAALWLAIHFHINHMTRFVYITTRGVCVCERETRPDQTIRQSQKMTRKWVKIKEGKKNNYYWSTFWQNLKQQNKTGV